MERDDSTVSRHEFYLFGMSVFVIIGAVCGAVIQDAWGPGLAAFLAVLSNGLGVVYFFKAQRERRQ